MECVDFVTSALWFYREREGCRIRQAAGDQKGQEGARRTVLGATSTPADTGTPAAVPSPPAWLSVGHRSSLPQTRLRVSP